MSSETSEKSAYLAKRPGFSGRTSGTFQKGADSRRPAGLRLEDGRTLASIARKKSPELLRLLYKAAKNEDVPWPVRVRCAELVIERGHGKPVQPVLQATERPIDAYTLEELQAIAEGRLPRLVHESAGRTVESECTEISDGSVVETSDTTISSNPTLDRASGPVYPAGTAFLTADEGK